MDLDLLDPYAVGLAPLEEEVSENGSVLDALDDVDRRRVLTMPQDIESDDDEVRPASLRDYLVDSGERTPSEESMSERRQEARAYAMEVERLGRLREELSNEVRELKMYSQDHSHLQKNTIQTQIQADARDERYRAVLKAHSQEIQQLSEQAAQDREALQEAQAKLKSAHAKHEDDARTIIEKSNQLAAAQDREAKLQSDLSAWRSARHDAISSAQFFPQHCLDTASSAATSVYNDLDEKKSISSQQYTTPTADSIDAYLMASSDSMTESSSIDAVLKRHKRRNSELKQRLKAAEAALRQLSEHRKSEAQLAAAENQKLVSELEKLRTRFHTDKSALAASVAKVQNDEIYALRAKCLDLERRLTDYDRKHEAPGDLRAAAARAAAMIAGPKSRDELQLDILEHQKYFDANMANAIATAAANANADRNAAVAGAVAELQHLLLVLTSEHEAAISDYERGLAEAKIGLRAQHQSQRIDQDQAHAAVFAVQAARSFRLESIIDNLQAEIASQQAIYKKHAETEREANTSTIETLRAAKDAALEACLEAENNTKRTHEQYEIAVAERDTAFLSVEQFRVHLNEMTQAKLAAEDTLEHFRDDYTAIVAESEEFRKVQGEAEELIGSLRRQYASVVTECDDAHKAHDETKEALNTLRNQHASVFTECEALRKAQYEAEDLIKKQHDQYAAVFAECEDLRRAQGEAEELIEKQRDQYLSVLAEYDAASVSIEELQASVKELETAKVEAEAAAKRWHDQHEALVAEHDAVSVSVDDVQTNLSELRLAKLEADATAERLRDDNASAIAERDAALANIQTLQKDLNELRSAKLELEETAKRWRNDYATVVSELNTTSSTIDKLRTSLNELRAAKNEAEVTVKRWNDDYAAISAERTEATTKIEKLKKSVNELRAAKVKAEATAKHWFEEHAIVVAERDGISDSMDELRASLGELRRAHAKKEGYEMKCAAEVETLRRELQTEKAELYARQDAALAEAVASAALAEARHSQELQAAAAREIKANDGIEAGRTQLVELEFKRECERTLAMALDDFERRLATERREARRALENGLAEATASAALAAERESTRRLESWKQETERIVNEARTIERHDAEKRFTEDLRRHDKEASALRDKLREAKRLVQDMANTTRAMKPYRAQEKIVSSNSESNTVILAASEQIQALSAQLVTARADAKRERERRVETEKKMSDHTKEVEQRFEYSVVARIDAILLNNELPAQDLSRGGTTSIDAALHRLAKKCQANYHHQHQSTEISELLTLLRQRETDCARCDHWRRQAHEARTGLEDAVDRLSEETQLKIDTAVSKRDAQHAAYIRDLRHRASAWLRDIRTEWLRSARSALADQRRRLLSHHHRPDRLSSSLSKHIHSRGQRTHETALRTTEPTAFLSDHVQRLDDLFRSSGLRID